MIESTEESDQVLDTLSKPSRSMNALERRNQHSVRSEKKWNFKIGFDKSLINRDFQLKLPNFCVIWSNNK